MVLRGDCHASRPVCLICAGRPAWWTSSQEAKQSPEHVGDAICEKIAKYHWHCQHEHASYQREATPAAKVGGESWANELREVGEWV